MYGEKNSNPNFRGHYNYANVKRWSQKVHEKDIFNMQYIFVPINKDGIHWTLAVIDMEKKCIQYYDSCAGDKNAAKFGSKMMDGLLAYVADESTREIMVDLSIRYSRLVVTAMGWETMLERGPPERSVRFRRRFKLPLRGVLRSSMVSMTVPDNVVDDLDG